MNFVESLPQEVTYLILEKTDCSSFLTAKYVAKGWNQVITSCLKDRIFSQYFPDIPASENQFNERLITSIDESVIKFVSRFLEQLKINNQLT